LVLLGKIKKPKKLFGNGFLGENRRKKTIEVD
jgi:hypothetical protein